MPDIPIRCGAVSLVALRRRDGVDEVLLLRRTRHLAGTWCHVAGAIEAGETAWQAAERELAEETGLSPLALYSGDLCEQFYEAGRDAISLLPVFVARIDPTAPVRLNAEHSDHRWLTFDEAVALVSFAGQRRLLRHVEAEFALRDPSPHLRIR